MIEQDSVYPSAPDQAVRARTLTRSTAYLTRTLRMLRLGIHLAQGVMLAAWVYPRCRAERQHALIQGWSRRLLRILNISLHCYDQPHALPPKCLLVANHVSWLDIFAISAVFPATFVAKAEVRDWPFVGTLCERTGTIFIERNSSRGARRASRDIAHALNRGTRPVVVYPEGTTTLGAELKPFRPALLQSAVDTAALVCPLALRYVDGQGVRTEVAAWVGDASLLDSIVGLVRQQEIALELRFLAAWSGGGHTRREIAMRAQSVIARALALPCAAVPAASLKAA
ncbi:MAG TPA: lysophospholipid acyltransferase family protein [Burkholderiales bacterium]|nr:lysophospholipid acyltransferase family protein [Burkholderiales bacterium]